MLLSKAEGLERLVDSSAVPAARRAYPSSLARTVSRPLPDIAHGRVSLSLASEYKVVMERERDAIFGHLYLWTKLL